jgi:hypothetical protein
LSTDFVSLVSSSPGPSNSTHGTGLVYKFLAKLLLINLSRHDRLGHNRSSRQARSACRASDTPFQTVSNLTNRKISRSVIENPGQSGIFLWPAMLSQPFDPATRLVANHPEAIRKHTRADATGL